MSKNVGVFANVTNQFYVTLTAFRGGKIDYATYLERAVGGESLYRAFAYGVQSGTEATRFIECLSKLGYELKYKEAADGAKIDGKNRDWNVGMAMDVARIIDRLDVVVIGSNDPDLVPLVQFVKDKGVKCIVFSTRVSDELRRVADVTIEVTEDTLESKRPVAVSA